MLIHCFKGHLLIFVLGVDVFYELKKLTITQHMRQYIYILLHHDILRDVTFSDR